MNRKQFLQRLLQKSDQGRYHDYVRVHLNQTMEENSPPATIKRMQILQMGCGRINAALPKNGSQTQKDKYLRNNQTTANQNNGSRKVFIMQKSRSPYEKKVNHNNAQDQHNCIQKNIKHRNHQLARQIVACIAEQKQQIRNMLLKSQGTDPLVLDFSENNKNNKTVTTSSQSPLRRGPHSNTFRANRNIANSNPIVSFSNQQLTKPKKSTIVDLISKATNPITQPPRPVQIQEQRYSSNTKTKQFTVSEEFNNNHTNKDNETQSYNCMHKPISSTQSQSQKFQRKYISSNKKIISKKFDEQIGKNYQKNKNIQKQNKILFRQQVNKNYGKPFTPPPKLSAKSYIVVQQVSGEQAQNVELAHTNSNKFGISAKNWNLSSKINKNNNFGHSKTTKNIKQPNTSILNLSNIKIHAAFNSKNSVEVASLTKIMTCIVAIEICNRFNLDSKMQEIKIGKFQANIGGTSARIQEGDIYTLENLFYGLMLPSGNDASLAIAVWGGRTLLHRTDTENMLTDSLPLKKYLKKQCYDRFIRQMNNKAKQLQLSKTNYANSHGLINTMNRSCAFDIACLSLYAMKNQYFRQIVSTKTYTKIIKTQIKQEVEIQVNAIELELQEQLDDVKQNDITLQFQYKSLPSNAIQQSNPFSRGNEFEQQEDQEQDEDDESESDDQKQTSKSTNKNLYSANKDRNGYCKSSFNEQPKVKKDNNKITKAKTYKYATGQKQICWQNTHKLLHKKNSEYVGIKTGVTTVAGPCLSSCVVTQCGRQFYIVVLNCKKMLSRFKQTDILKKWIFKQEGIRVGIKKTRPTSAKTYSNSLDVEAQEQLDSQEEQNINQNED